MKVLLIAPSPRVIGGQSIQAQRLLTNLSKSPEVSVRFQPTGFPLSLFGIPFGRLRYFRTFLNSIGYVWNLMFRIPGVEIVHIFTAANVPFLLVAAPALLLARLFAVKSVLHYHDGRGPGHLHQSPAAVALCRLADSIVVPSNFLVDVFARHNLVAIPISNLLETHGYRFRLRQHPRPVFLHNRGLEPEYNVSCTLRAFKLIQKRYTDARLVIAHDGSLRGQLEEQVASLNLRNVEFTGSISPEAMADFYDRADIYLTSADYDNLPGSVLEAFASGLPVVATRAGGTEWIVRNGQNGLLAPCNDHEAIAAAVFQLLETPGLAARLSQTAVLGLARYSWEVVGFEWLRLYRFLAGRTATPAYGSQEAAASSAAAPTPRVTAATVKCSGG